MQNRDVILERLSENKDPDLTFNYYIKQIPLGLDSKAKKYLKQHNLLGTKEENILMKLVKLKYQKSLVPPGEAVGVLAAQSLGEQTTQMT